MLVGKRISFTMELIWAPVLAVSFKNCKILNEMFNLTDVSSLK